MDHHRQENDPVEALLGELQDAAHAGVFRSTSVDPGELLTDRRLATPEWMTWLRKPRVAWSLAASLALAATVWTWMFRSELRSIRNQRDAIALMDRDHGIEPAREPRRPSQANRFSADCMTGPAEEADDPCNDSDLVTDRHVDLRDFGLHQRSLARR